MDVTADGDRALHLLDVRLLRQNLFGLEREEQVSVEDDTEWYS